MPSDPLSRLNSSQPWQACDPTPEGHAQWIAITGGPRSVALTTRVHEPHGVVYSTLRIRPFETNLRLW